MKIKCNNLGANKSISVNTDYEVIVELGNRYTILNDKGVEKNYAKNLFTVIPEVPEVPPVQVIDELNITTDISTNDENEIVTAKISIGLTDELTYSKETAIGNFNDTAISCGIFQYTGVDNLCTFLTRAKTEFRAFVRQNQGIELNAEINVNETFKEVAETLVQDLIAATPESCMVILSTNVTGNNHLNNDVVAALDAVSVSTLEKRNPNSGNQIKLWTLDTNEE